MGSGFSGLASPILITELAHPVERGKVTALYKYVVVLPDRDYSMLTDI